MAQDDGVRRRDRPPAERRALERAWEIATRCLSDAFDPPVAEQAPTLEAVDGWDETTVVAYAHAVTLRELAQFAYLNPGGGRCGWCVGAAGDTDAAYQSVPWMTRDDLRAHVLACAHHPHVAKIAELERDIEMIRGHLLPGSNDLVDEVRASRGQIKALTTRRQELLETIARLTRDVPYEEEQGQAAVLIAEVGTLRARLAEIERRAADASGPDQWALAMWRTTADELRDLQRRYAAALPAAARVAAFVRTARDTLTYDREELGTENVEAAEAVRAWGDVAAAFEREHGDPGDPTDTGKFQRAEPDGAVSPRALSGAQDGGGPP